ncbi:MAG: histidine phosphatase family protein [Chloroflexi bacterium]|nr:histidine phosphatase family protein [Chloroflexota bacterium]MBV9599415.1 histidine phosphatase family protein [Chloroflexota bacterium]
MTAFPQIPTNGAIDQATTLLLVRHAETEDNVNMRLSGWTDTDLSPRGESQTELLADHFNRHHGQVDELYTSPLIRARRTAEAIGALTGHTPVLLDDLREMYFGDLDGRPFEELRDAYAHLLAADENSEVEDFMWPGGESRSGFMSRVLRVTNTIAARHPGRPVGVVTHGGFIATLLTILHGESPARWRKWVVPNASLSEIVWDSSACRGALVRHGDASHLEALLPLEPTE